jgi:5-methylcytosine-specific restriction endonuclease McrA
MQLMRPCEHCQTSFRPPRPETRFCSKSCATAHRHPGPKRVRRWGPRPAVDPAHPRLRALLLPDALGWPCVMGCGRVISESNAQLDHIIPRSQGGPTVRANVRIICADCNQRRGSQLGGRRAHKRGQHHG